MKIHSNMGSNTMWELKKYTSINNLSAYNYLIEKNVPSTYFISSLQLPLK